MFAYISSSLTDLTESERAVYLQFYEDMASVCRKFGFETYLPHHYGDPVRFPDLTPEQIDEIDRRAVTLSGIVVAYIGKASTGTGIELELCHHADKPLILLYEKGRKVSRLPRGAPAQISRIEFADFKDGLQQLAQALLGLRKKEEAKAWMPEPLRLFARQTA